MLSVPKNLRNVWNSAPPKPPCPDGYDGNGGVKFGPVRLRGGAPIGVQVRSPVVDAAPSPGPVGPGSRSDSRMPVTGRQVSSSELGVGRSPTAWSQGVTVG